MSEKLYDYFLDFIFGNWIFQIIYIYILWWLILMFIFLVVFPLQEEMPKSPNSELRILTSVLNQIRFRSKYSFSLSSIGVRFLSITIYSSSLASNCQPTTNYPYPFVCIMYAFPTFSFPLSHLPSSYMIWSSRGRDWDQSAFWRVIKKVFVSWKGEEKYVLVLSIISKELNRP